MTKFVNTDYSFYIYTVLNNKHTNKNEIIMTTATNNIDTLENVKALIVKVERLIDCTKGDIKNAWYSFLRECKDFIYMVGVEVEDIKENEAMTGKAVLVSKVNDFNDYEYCKKHIRGSRELDTIKIVRIVNLPALKFVNFSDDLMSHYPFFKSSDSEYGIGGTGSDYDVLNAKFPQYGDFEKMEYHTFCNICHENEDVMKVWRDNAYEEAVLIRCKSTGQMIVSSPQGYTYSRYTSFEFSLGTSK